MTITLQSRNFEAFFGAPFAAYGKDSPYVSPLKSDLRRFLDTSQNPLFSGDSTLTYFTAHRGAQVVGRITAHMHAESNALHGWSRGYFGYFDCVDDLDVARALLTAAQDWCRARGMTRMMGNFNLTAMQQIGVMTSDFEKPPYLDLIFSPAHIARLLSECGYAPEFPMTTFELDLTTAEPPAVGPKQQAVRDNPDFSFAPISRRTIPQRMEEARLILNASFAKNPMFVPVTAAEFHFQAKDMKWVMDPRISAVLHHKGAPAACIICVPDMNPFLRRIGSRMGLNVPFQFVRHRVRNRRAVLIFSGVMPELQGQGVNPVVLREVIMAMQKAGYERLGNTWIADENGASLAQKAKAGAAPLHRLHLFGKDI